jgi:integrase
LPNILKSYDTRADTRELDLSMDKPEKPYVGYHLFAHDNGQWAKKIRGKLHYFGAWSDPAAAMALFLQQRDHLFAGLRPPTDEPKVADLLDTFLGPKDRALKAGEIEQVTYDEYEAVCDTMAAWGKHRHLSTLTPADFGELREALGQGKTKQLGAVTVKRRLTIARMILKHARKLRVTLDYDDDLRSPSARTLRQIKNSKVRLFTSKQVREIVKNADGELRGMILLGVNCGFGPKDCCDLPTARVNLKSGWHNFHRIKTGIERRCPLWPETVKALRGATNNGHVFRSSWNRRNIAYHFRKLVDDFYVKDVTEFYSLRRTFETIATSSGASQAAVDLVMGHVPASDDMSAVYRQKIFDEQLLQCTNHVREWYQGKRPSLDTF